MHNNQVAINNIPLIKERRYVIQISREYACSFQQIKYDVEGILTQFLENLSDQFNTKQEEINLIFEDLAFQLKPQSQMQSFDYFSSSSSQKRPIKIKGERSNCSFLSSHSLDSQSARQLIRSRSVDFRSKALHKLKRLKKQKSQGSVACFDC